MGNSKILQSQLKYVKITIAFKIPFMWFLCFGFNRYINLHVSMFIWKNGRKHNNFSEELIRKVF